MGNTSLGSHRQNPTKECLVYVMIDSMSDTTYVTYDTIAKLNPETTGTQIDLTTLTSNKQQVDCDIVTGLKVWAYRGTEQHSLPSFYSHPYCLSTAT